MTVEVKGLGYAVIGTPDIDEWKRFGSDLLGLQVAEQTPDRLLLRMDDFAYRLDVRAGAPRGVSTLGWDAGNAQSLADIAKTLSSAGYEVEYPGPEVAAEREVSDLIRFRDPDDAIDVEFFWGLRRVVPKFVSPAGATFVTASRQGQNMGFGHVLQLVTAIETHRRLYVDLLGLQISDWIDPGDGTVAWFLRCNPRHHSYAFVTSQAKGPGIAHLMLEVDDLDVLGRIYDNALSGEFPVLSTLGRHTNDKMISFYVGGPGGVGVEFGYGGLQVDEAVWQPSRYEAAHYWGHRRTGQTPPA